MRRVTMTKFVLAPLAIGAATALLLTYIQVRIRLYPVSAPVAPQPADSPFQRVSFETDDGLTISAWYAPPTARAGQAILFLHGLEGNRDQLLPQAAFILEAGYGALLIDFRNHGESDGTVTSMGFHEIKDARAAYEFLLARPEVKAAAIWGFSMGGAVACKLMSEVDATGLVVDATFSDFPAQVRARAIRQGYPAALSEWLFIGVYGALSDSSPADVRPAEDIAQVHGPVLLFHGNEDDAVSVTEARQLAAANPRVRLSIYAGGGHGDLLELDPLRYRAESLAYLEEVFQATTAS